MGVYIYSVRTKSVTAEIEGRVETIHALSYLGRSCTGWDGAEPRGLQLAIEKAHTTWANRETPKFVALADDAKFEDGQPVYEWDGRPCDYDTPKFNGVKRLVGFLRKGKKGRKTVWTVELTRFNVQVGVWVEGPCFRIRARASYFTVADVIEFAKANLKPGEVVRSEPCEAGPNRAGLLRKPSEESIHDAASVLLHGPWPVELWEREAPARAAAANYLMAHGLVEVYAENYKGEDEKPYWHGRLNYRLTDRGLQKLLGIESGRYKIKLTTEMVVFTGGKFGEHSIFRNCSSLERVKAHWDGYCEAQAQA